jgi:chitodextrinase
VIPEVTASECVGGVLTFPSITAPQTEGIVYSWDPDDVVFGGTVIVTATLLPGYTWPAGVDEAGLFDRSMEVSQLASVSPSGQIVSVAQAAPTWPEEWVIVNETTATYTLELVERTCEEVVLPNLAIANAVCLAGTPGDPTLSVSSTTGVAYSYDEDDVVNGGSVLVTATLTDGYKWGTLSNGWSVIDPATAALSVDFDDVECNRAAPSPNNPVVKGLPNTGAAENTSAASGLWMLAATGAFGAAVAGLGLRKRPEH